MMRGDRYATAPASTTACASSGVCLQTSLMAEAEMRLRVISGSWMHSTSRGTVPASRTFCARSDGSKSVCTKERKIEREPSVGDTETGIVRGGSAQ